MVDPFTNGGLYSISYGNRGLYQWSTLLAFFVRIGAFTNGGPFYFLKYKLGPYLMVNPSIISHANTDLFQWFTFLVFLIGIGPLPMVNPFSVSYTNMVLYGELT